MGHGAPCSPSSANFALAVLGSPLPAGLRGQGGVSQARSWATARRRREESRRTALATSGWLPEAGEGASCESRSPAAAPGSGIRSRGGGGRLLEPRTSAGRARADLLSRGDAQDTLGQEALGCDLDGSLSWETSRWPGKSPARRCQGRSHKGWGRRSDWASREDPFASALGFLEGGGLKIRTEKGERYVRVCV